MSAPARVLAGVVAAVLLLSACGRGTGDESVPAVPGLPSVSTPAPPAPTISETTEADRDQVLDFATSAFASILARTPTGYDEEVDAASGLMTPDLASQFRTSAAQDRRLMVEAEATDRGLVGIYADKAQVLVFGKETLHRRGRPEQITRPTVVLGLDLSGDTPLVSSIDVGTAGETADRVAEQDAERQTILYRAALVADAFVNVDYRTADDKLAKVRRLSTGRFLMQYNRGRNVLLRTVRSSQSVLMGEVVAAGLSGIDGHSATVLVATTGSVASLDTGTDPVRRDVNLRIRLANPTGDWLATGLQIVG